MGVRLVARKSLTLTARYIYANNADTIVVRFSLILRKGIAIVRLATKGCIRGIT